MNIFEVGKIIEETISYYSLRVTPGSTFLLAFQMKRGETGIYSPVIALQRLFSINPKELGIPDRIYNIEAKLDRDYDSRGKALETSPFAQISNFLRVHNSIMYEGEKQRATAIAQSNKERDELIAEIDDKYEDKQPAVSSLQTIGVAVATGGVIVAPDSCTLKDIENVANYSIRLSRKQLDKIVECVRLFNEDEQVKNSQEEWLTMFIEINYPRNLNMAEQAQKMYAGKNATYKLRKITLDDIKESTPDDIFDKFSQRFSSIVTDEESIYSKVPLETNVSPDLIKSYLGRLMLKSTDIYADAFKYNEENVEKVSNYISLISDISHISRANTLLDDLGLTNNIINVPNTEKSRIDSEEEKHNETMDDAINDILKGADLDDISDEDLYEDEDEGEI